MKKPIAKVADAASKTPDIDARSPRATGIHYGTHCGSGTLSSLKRTSHSVTFPIAGPLVAKIQGIDPDRRQCLHDASLRPGICRHIQNAIKLGATREEVLEVLELVTVLGIHACNMGVPILADELAAPKAAASDDAV
jgi:hypothetical protein